MGYLCIQCVHPERMKPWHGISSMPFNDEDEDPSGQMIFPGICIGGRNSRRWLRVDGEGEISREEVLLAKVCKYYLADRV